MSSFGTKLEEVIEEGIVDEMLHESQERTVFSIKNMNTTAHPVGVLFGKKEEEEETQVGQVNEQLEIGDKTESEAVVMPRTIELLVDSVSHSTDGLLESGSF
jgi:hypothetical protein